MNELEQLIISSGWFESGRTLRETIAQFELFRHKPKYIKEIVLNMYNRKILYTYPSKFVGTYYKLSVQPDIESDVGI